MLLGVVTTEVLGWTFVLPCFLIFLCLFLWIASSLMAWNSTTFKHQSWLNSLRFSVCLMSGPSEQFSPTASSEQSPSGYVKEESMPPWCESQNFIFPLSATLRPTKNLILQCIYDRVHCLSFTGTRTCIHGYRTKCVFSMYLVQRVCSWIKIFWLFATAFQYRL